MQIAIVGWGSLLWENTSLVPNKAADNFLDIHKTGWNKDGPILPLEFCRISSKSGRVTLVISHMHGVMCTTYWALSSSNNFEQASDNLIRREGNDKARKPGDKIHWIKKDNTHHCDDPLALAIIKEWFLRKTELDAVIWTGLNCNWSQIRNTDFSLQDLEKYLHSKILAGDQKDIFTYFNETYDQIQTPAREVVRRLAKDK